MPSISKLIADLRTGGLDVIFSLQEVLAEQDMTRDKRIAAIVAMIDRILLALPVVFGIGGVK